MQKVLVILLIPRIKSLNPVFFYWRCQKIGSRKAAGITEAGKELEQKQCIANWRDILLMKSYQLRQKLRKDNAQDTSGIPWICTYV